MTKPPVIGFAAFSGTGKTTLLEQLLPILTRTGLRVGMVKASHHDINPDKPGKDSYKLRRAGTAQLVLSTPQRSICYTDYAPPIERTLDEQLRLLDMERLDLVIVEGFREAAIPKIELHRQDYHKPFLFEQDAHIMALAWDGNPGIEVPEHLPLLDINSPEQIADFVLTHFVEKKEIKHD